MQYLLYPVALYFVLIGIRYLITFLQLRKAVLQYPKFQARSAKTLPAELQQVFQTAIAQLGTYGFKPCCYLEARSMSKVEPPTGWELLLYHCEHKTYAKVGLRLLAEPTDLFEITFYTFFKDRSLLITLNGQAHGVIGKVPKATVQDPYSADGSVQWQMHQEKLSQLALSQPPCALAPEIFLKALQTHIREYLDALVPKMLVKTGSQEFKLGRRALYQQLFAGMQANKKVAKMAQQRRTLAKPEGKPPEIPLELEVQSYQRMEFLQKNLVGRKFRTWLLLGSLALFIVSYTQVFSPERFAVFMAALILHEGGHLLAMKLFGYQDTALMFVPFLGALATARKDDATLTQKFWISLAGPLPGLILGIACLAVAIRTQTEGLLYEASWILISLNLFNLLPIYPLDGGQIADLLVFSRHPYIGVGFKSIGVLLLGLLGLAQPMMFVFAGLIALGIPNSFRVAKITSKLRSELRQTRPFSYATQQDTLRTILHHLKQLGHGNLPFAQRYTLTKTLLTSHRELHAKRRTRFGLSLLYCISLFGGILGTLQAITPNWPELVAQAAQTSKGIEAYKAEQQRIVEATTAEIAANPNDTKAYKKRAEAYLGLQQIEAALTDYDQIVRLNPDNIQHLMMRATYRSMTQNYQGAIQDYDRILQLEPKNVEAYQRRAGYRNLAKDHSGALADYNAAIKLAPDDYGLYLGRAYIRQELKDFKGMIADANTIIRFEPDNADAYALRSEAHHQLGARQAAEADQQKADQLYETWEEEEWEEE